MKKKPFFILFLLIAASVIFTAQTGAFAVETVNIDYEKKGSVSVCLNCNSVGVSGAEMALYQIAEAYNDNGKMNFKYTKEFASYRVSLSSLQTQESVEALMDHICVSSIACVSTQKTDEDGKIVFSDLPLGIYFVTQTGCVSGYSDCLPFLIIVPNVENGKVYYDVDASPKTQIERFIDITVKKKWNDDIDKHDPIKVMLYKDSKAQGSSVELNEENNWTYTWSNMPQSDLYSVAEVDVPLGYYASYKHNGYYFTVTNSTELIKTGQQKALIPILAILGVFIFLVGLIKSYGGKRKNEE